MGQHRTLSCMSPSVAAPSYDHLVLRLGSQTLVVLVPLKPRVIRISECDRPLKPNERILLIASDGDVVFQPLKVERSGISGAVRGHVLIYIHKEQALADVERRYPAERYVMVDDKLRILAATKKVWGEHVTTTVSVQRQGLSEFLRRTTPIQTSREASEFSRPQEISA